MEFSKKQCPTEFIEVWHLNRFSVFDKYRLTGFKFIIAFWTKPKHKRTYFNSMNSGS